MLPGLNHNIPFQGKVYHVQTEDSGRGHPHIITHVFIDGRIIASRKSGYGARLGEADLNAVVKTLMQEQHKDVIRDLIHARLPGVRAPAPAVRPAPAKPNPAAPVKPAAPRSSAAPKTPAHPVEKPRTLGSAFGKDLVSDRGLDDVILQFITDEISRSDRGKGKK